MLIKWQPGGVGLVNNMVVVSIVEIFFLTILPTSIFGRPNFILFYADDVSRLLVTVLIEIGLIVVHLSVVFSFSLDMVTSPYMVILHPPHPTLTSWPGRASDLPTFIQLHQYAVHQGIYRCINN